MHQIEAIRAASRHLVRELGFLDKTIAGTQLSASGVHTLIELGLTPGINAKELSDRLKLDKSSISRLLQSLQKRELVSQYKSDNDGRYSQLFLTSRGQAAYFSINDFGIQQVQGALAYLDQERTETIANSLSDYAEALKKSNKYNNANETQALPTKHSILEGYYTGMIGDVAAMHARAHADIVGNGPQFESIVSQAMAEFIPRLADKVNQSWNVLEGGRVVGSISIDGEDLGDKTAHLRWFILSDHLQGKGLGRVLLQKAIEHCEHNEFEQVHLWTLKGLAPARRLYEKNGFKLEDEYVGEQWGTPVVEQKFILSL